MIRKEPPWEKGLSKRSVSTLRLKLLLDYTLKYDCKSHLDVGGNVTPYVDITRALGLYAERCDIKNYTDDTIVCGLPSLPFKTSAFDIVSCFDVLEHLKTPEKNLQELCRVAKKVVILGVPDEKSSVWCGDSSHITPFSYTKLKKMQVERWHQIIYGDTNLPKIFKGVSYALPALFSEVFIVVYVNKKYL